MPEDHDFPFKGEKFARVFLDPWMLSTTYRGLRTSHEKCLATMFFAYQSQKGAIADRRALLLDIAGASDAEDTPEFVAFVRDVLTRAKFKVVDGSWVNEKSMAVFRVHDEAERTRSRVGSLGGRASAEKRRGTSGSTVGSTDGSTSVQPEVQPEVQPKVEPPSSLVSSPTNSKRDGCTALIPFEEDRTLVAEVVPPLVAPRRNQNIPFEFAKLFFRARFERTKTTDAAYFEPPGGTIARAATYIKASMSNGNDPRLLASLPALIDEDKLNLLDNPYTILEDGSRPRISKGGHTVAGVDHAAIMGARLHGLKVSTRQADILRVIGTWTWCHEQGVVEARKVVVR